MIRAILTPKLLLGAPAKFKRPYHLVTSTLRATSATVIESSDPYGSLMRLQQSIEMMGQPPFQWAAPNGFPDTLEYWAGIILPRLNFGADVLTHGIANVKIDVALLLSARSSTEAVQLINNALFAGEMSLSLTSRLNQYLTQNPSSDARISALGLALASPDFQWY